MTPGAATWPAGDRPGESPEVATWWIRYDNGDKIALIRDLCTKVRQENKESEKKYAETRDLASKIDSSRHCYERHKMKISDDSSESQISVKWDIPHQQWCFDNLLIGKIDDDRALRAKVRNELITNTLDKIQGEYPIDCRAKIKTRDFIWKRG